jgi:3-hydroxyacyl-CoA dehydrogenase / enoyl-CoA hydratase / 3-hydroxybutyryl-CoA epimerase
MNSISIEPQKSGVSILKINTPASDENFLSEDCIQSLGEFLDTIERQMDMVESDDEIKAVILLSGKEGSFISGPVFSEYLNFTLADEGRTYCLRLQDLSDKIENSRTPFVAAINGACLGIGLELALACNLRVASGTKNTLLSMNQIDYGLIPSAGGMQRLAKLLGTKQALDMILSGEPIDADDSLDMGLVDELVPQELLLRISEARAIELITKHSHPKRFNLKNIPGTLINENPVARKMLFKKVRGDIRVERDHSNNAQVMAVEALEIGINSNSRGLHAESVYFGELAVTTYARQLIKTEISAQEVKQSDLYLKPGSEAPDNLEKAAVIGESSGAIKMASLLADKGTAVRLRCSEDRAAGRVLKGCRDYFSDKYEDYAMKDIILEKKLDLISATLGYTGFKRARIIIESEPEDLEIKKKVLSEAESVSGSDAIYLSCSFALPLSLISQDCRRPDKTIGMNVLGLLNETELFEISASERTSKETVAEIVGISRRLGKTPLVLKDGAGFYTSRVWLSYLNESLHLLSEGVLFDDIEEAMTGFGFEDGPLSAIDEAGLIFVRDGLNILFEHFGERLKPHPYLDLMIDDGRMGVASDRGFYKYIKDEKRFDKSLYKLLSISERDIEGVSLDYIQERLLLAMVNESLICLEQGVLPGAKEADVACVLGLGFPRHRGGPFRYIDSGGAAETLKKLHNLSIKYGARYAPPPLLKDVAVGPNRFYED